MNERALSTMLLALTACASSPKPIPFALAAAPQGTLTAGMVASTETAEDQARAFAAFVQKATGRETRPAVVPDYERLALEISKGTIDVAFMPPLAYVRVEDPSKVRLLAKATRHGQITYRSVLFSRPGSPIKSLEDLNKARDLRAAWVDPSSATGYLFAKALLLKRKIDPAGIFRVQDFLWTHDALCTAVQSGKADVGATFSDDPTGEPAVHATGCQAALGDKVGTLQIIAATEPIPYEVLAVRAGLPEVERAALLAAVYELEKNEEGRKVLADAFHCQGFTGASDRDYDMVRAETGTFAQ